MRARMNDEAGFPNWKLPGRSCLHAPELCDNFALAALVPRQTVVTAMSSGEDLEVGQRLRRPAVSVEYKATPVRD